MLNFSLLLVQLLVSLIAARAAGRVARALGQPRVIGEMVAGILLGPSVFGGLAPAAMATVFPPEGMEPLATLSNLGVTLFMFVVGLRMNLGELRQNAKSAVAISQASIILPFLLGAAFGWSLFPELAGAHATRLGFVLFLGAAMSVTAFPVLARILTEQGLLTTRLGTVTLACAAVDDVTAWCLLAAAVAVARAGDTLGTLFTTLAGVAVYTVLVMTLGRRALESWDARRRARDGAASAEGEVVGAAVLIALASALVTETLGVHALFGAFLAGVVVPRRTGLAAAVDERLNEIVGTLLLPIFFVLTGLRTDIGVIATTNLWGVLIVILALAVGGKLGGSALAARLTGLPWRESAAIGLLMNTRGLMELVILNVGLEIGVIGTALFSMMVVMALTTTIMTSPLLGLLLRSRAGVHTDLDDIDPAADNRTNIHRTRRPTH